MGKFEVFSSLSYAAGFCEILKVRLASLKLIFISFLSIGLVCFFNYRLMNSPRLSCDP